MAKENKVKNFMKRHAFIVVFLIAAVIAVANYLVYPLFISKDLELMEIPIAKQTIYEGTEITEDMITTVSISKELLPSGIYLYSEYIVGRYVEQNTTIPTNGFFYAESLTDHESALGGTHKELEEGQYAYTLEVDDRFFQTSFKVGQRVNIYFYCWNSIETGEGDETTSSLGTIEGLLLENRKVISLSGDDTTTHYITIAVTEEEMAYLNSAVEIATHYQGKVVPIIYYGSDGTNATETMFHDIDELKLYIKEMSNMHELTDEEKTKKILGIDGEPEEDAEGETIQEGGDIVE